MQLAPAQLFMLQRNDRLRNLSPQCPRLPHVAAA